MYTSLKDRDPNVFMRTTIGRYAFVYDGDSYSSVLECFNDRKIFPFLWKPDTVPLFHKANLTNAIGFMTNKDTEDCYTFDYDVNDVLLGNKCKQFKIIVCAYLFKLYYESVMKSIQTFKEQSEVMSRYQDIYDACTAICKSITLNSSMLLLEDYDLTESSVDWCCVVYDGKGKLPDKIRLPKCYSIRMSANTFKALRTKGYGWVSKFPAVDIVIACEGQDIMNDYYWTLVRQGGYEPHLVPDYVGYQGGFTVFLGTTDNQEILREVNWNRAYVCGGD